MLKALNNDYFLKKGITDQGYIFFIQRWLELLDSRTIDTHQYSILNSFVALIEFKEVVENTLTGVYSTNDNYESCRLELIRLLKEDDIFVSENISLHHNLLKIIGDNLNKDFDKRKAQLKKLNHQLSYNIDLIKNDYPKWIISHLKNDIIQNDKNNIQNHAKSLISQCILNGWTTKGLFELNRTLINFCDFESNWGSFCKIIFQEPCKHDVFISLQIPPPQ